MMAGYSSTGSALQFFTTPNPPTTWTASATATGTLNVEVLSGAADGSVAFGICCGVWLVIMGSNQYPNFVFGTSGQSLLRVCALYSLDFGQTWHPANLDMNPMTLGNSLRVIPGVDQFLVLTDSGIAMSGRLGYSETL